MQSPNHIPPTQGSDEHVQAWVLSDRVHNDQIDSIGVENRTVPSVGFDKGQLSLLCVDDLYYTMFHTVKEEINSTFISQMVHSWNLPIANLHVTKTGRRRFNH